MKYAPCCSVQMGGQLGNTELHEVQMKFKVSRFVNKLVMEAMSSKLRNGDSSVAECL
jgi:hypothetical protein